MRSTAAIHPAAKASTRRRKTAGPEGGAAIAVWDVGASVPLIDEVFERWNRLAGPMRFVQVFISAPRQTLVAGERTIRAALAIDPRLKKYEEELALNLFVDGALTVAEEARKKGGFDKIALLTPHMLAFKEDNEVRFNHYSGSWGDVTFISAFEMRKFAKRAKRPFTHSMCALLLAQILQNRYHPAVGFHVENRGCLFDHNAERATVVDTFRAMQIEPSCLHRIPEGDRSYVQKLVETLSK